MNEASRRKLDQNYDQQPNITHQLMFNLTKEWVKNKQVLDIGCWTGQYEFFAKDVVKSIIGLDSGKSAISYAQKKFAKFKNVSFIQGYADKLAFKKNTFDTVVMIEVFEHLPASSQPSSLTEVYRVLKSNGKFIISTPNKNIFSILLDPAYFIIGHRHYAAKELSLLLKKAGFSIVDIKIIGGFNMLFTNIVESIYKHLFQKKYPHSKSLDQKISQEFNQPGFARLIILAQK